MLALARFAMTKRLHALLLVGIFSLLPITAWLATSLIALVTLRLGAFEGGLTLLCALLPMVIGGLMDAPTPLHVVIPHISTLVLVVIASQIARVRGALLPGLVCVALCTAVLFGALEQVKPSWYILLQTEISQTVDQLIPTEQLSVKTQGESQKATVLHEAVLQSLSLSVAINGFIALLLGRWWQAALYNPLGFGREFHHLQLPAGIALLLALGFALGETNYLPAFRHVTLVLLLPLLLAGTAKLHRLVKTTGASTNWLVAYYAGLPLTYPAVAALACIDSVIDLTRLFNKQKNE